MDDSIRDLLDRYLRGLGLHQARDPAVAYQAALARQMTEHLAEVLDANEIAPSLRRVILREFLYGITPSQAEADLRQEMAAEMTRLAERAGPVPWVIPG